jgi:hypothetical protein
MIENPEDLNDLSDNFLLNYLDNLNYNPNKNN